jgi:1-deoxy-D-xylulose-5-phosphate synthase
LKIGESEVIHDGHDIALISLGHMIDVAIAARDQLSALGYSVALINARWIKPLDTAMLERYASRCKVLCTFEDHVIQNGFGAAVIDHLHTAGLHTPVERIAWPDAFIEHGKVSILREKHGMTAEAAVAKCLTHVPPVLSPVTTGREPALT